MKLGEFFLKPDIRLPTTWEKFTHFPQFVEKRFMQYLAWINQIDEPDSARVAIQGELNRTHEMMWPILDGIKLMFEGQPSDAYAKCAEGFEVIKPLLMEKLPAEVSRDELGILYRVRRHNGEALKREDLFHVPFEKRSKVASQRYSIPGLPCLYLCGSTHTCWAEMGQPPFHDLCASAYWLDEAKSVKLVNMSERPSTLAFRLTPDANLQNAADESLFVAHALLWPLMFACSVRVKERHDPFKPEYIVPQLLLQWIAKQKDLDGVCYFSTHVDGVSRRNPLLPCNFVFPAKQIKAEGRCSHLRRLFRMTTPYSWQLLSSIGGGDGTAENELAKFEFIPGVHVMYGQTEFGRVQQRLSNLARADMDRIQKGAKGLGMVAE